MSCLNAKQNIKSNFFRLWFDGKSVHLCFHYGEGNNLYFNIAKNKQKVRLLHEIVNRFCFHIVIFQSMHKIRQFEQNINKFFHSLVQHQHIDWYN